MKKIHIVLAVSIIFCLSLLLNSCQTAKSQWVPNGKELWNFTATPSTLHFWDPEKKNYYDVDISLNQTSFSYVPQTISCSISNKESGHLLCSRIYIEKYYNNIESLGKEAYIEEFGISGWVRIPFIMEGYWLKYSDDGRIAEGEIDLYKYLLADYEYTSGDYRIVFPLTDATHYAYFHIQNNN